MWETLRLPTPIPGQEIDMVSPPASPLPPKDQKIIKILLVGDRDTGKTSFAKRFIWKRYEALPHQHEPGVRDVYRKGVIVDGHSLGVDLLDYYSSDIENWKEQDEIISHGDGFILMYSVNRRSSYERMEAFYQSILRVKGDSASKVILLAGTQCDSPTMRVVRLQEGKELGRQFGCRYLETSAKTGDGVKLAVGRVIQKVLRLQQWSSILEEVPGHSEEPTSGQQVEIEDKGRRDSEDTLPTDKAGLQRVLKKLRKPNSLQTLKQRTLRMSSAS